MASQMWVSRGERERQIIRLIMREGRATRREVALGLGMAKSPHLVSILEDLVERGLLRKDVAIVRGRFEAWVYMLPERG